MLKFCCVNWRNYQGRGIEYVNILFNMIARNLPPGTEGRLICFTDTTDDADQYDPHIDLVLLPDGLEGWFNKLWLFSRDNPAFDHGDRIFYFDLDTIITGGLDELIKFVGLFGILEDVYRPKGYNSSVMSWVHPTMDDVWKEYERQGRPLTDGGDQAFIEQNYQTVIYLQSNYPGVFVSYRAQAQFSIPKGAKVVLFHGNPKPHEITAGWPVDFWKKNGASVFDNKVVGNTHDDVIISNIKSAIAKGYRFIPRPVETHDSHAVFVGGGPSVNDNIEEIRARQKAGQKIVALNGSFRWLFSHDIRPDFHVMLDARQENIDFVPWEGMRKDAQLYYSAQCDVAVLQEAGDALTCWIPYADGMPEALDGFQAAYIGGGSTVGLKALSLFWVLGYREFHLYGYDSSYQNASHHAYAQPGNDGEKLITVEVGGIKFTTAPWMATQATEFRELASYMINVQKCTITVHGYGLLPTVAARMSDKIPYDAIHQIDGVWWPATDNEANHQVTNQMADIPAILKHCSRYDACIQAGGNVGLWPLEFSKYFRQVFTFEPDEVNYKCLLMNLDSKAGIIAANAGLGEAPAKMGMARNIANCGAHQMEGEGDIEIMTIDSLGLGACNLIQLDIEGFELQALKGAEQTIRQFHPVIVTEEKGLGSKYEVLPDAISSYLLTLGYKVADKVSNDVIYTYNPNTRA